MPRAAYARWHDRDTGVGLRGRARERYRAKRCQPAVKGTDHAGRAVDDVVAGRANCALAAYTTVDMRHVKQNEIHRSSPLVDPDAAARKLIEITNSVQAGQDGRILIEKINGLFLYEFTGSPTEYGVGLKLAIERGWLVMHESGTYVKSLRRVRTCSHDHLHPLPGRRLGM
jgi:hypothetical protein